MITATTESRAAHEAQAISGMTGAHRAAKTALSALIRTAAALSRAKAADGKGQRRRTEQAAETAAKQAERADRAASKATLSARKEEEKARAAAASASRARERADFLTHREKCLRIIASRADIAASDAIKNSGVAKILAADARSVLERADATEER